MLGVGSDMKGMSQRPRAGLEPSLGQQETGGAGLQCLLSREMAGNEACMVGTLLNSRKQSGRQEPQMVASRCGVPHFASGTAWLQLLPLSSRQGVSEGGAGVHSVLEITSSRNSWKEARA